MEEFSRILTNLMNPANETRSSAEAQLEEISPEQRASFLFQYAVTQGGEGELRSMAMVLLRRLLSSNWDDVFKKWNPDTQNAFKADLLTATQVEPDNLIRKRFCDVIAEVARNLLDEDINWTELLEFIHQCAQSEDKNGKVTALTIFESIPCVFGPQQTQFLPVIKGMLEASLQPEMTLEVRTAASRAATAFLCDNEEDRAVLTSLQHLVPLILQVCAAVVASEDDDDTPLQCLGDLATSVPKILKPYLNDTCTFCIQVVSNKEYEDSIRHSALEVLVSLCESNAPMMRKQGAQFISPLIQQCLQLMVEIEEDEEWAAVDAVDDDDDNNAAVGETSLDRVAAALTGKQIFPFFTTLYPEMLKSTEWQHRHAALMGLSTIGEGCRDTMKPKIVPLVDSVVPFLQDPHPRVRYAACNALGQMATDFAPDLEKKCHAKVIPGLLATLDDLNNPRVAAHAAAAIVNFAEDCPKSILVGYLDPIMEKLEWTLQQTFKMLEGGKKHVLEQIITTIASVADTAEEQYVKYYDRVMPALKYIMENAKSTELRLLRGKTIECVSLIGLAVGREKFLPDASEIMNLLLTSQAEFGELEADDPQVSYMISASARICRLLGSDFAQYLPAVMPAVMKSAAFRPEVTVVDQDEKDQLGDEDEDWTFVGVGDQSLVGIKTAGLEDKANACQMLVCYAKELKGAFGDYIEDVAKLMIPLLKFYFHDQVRSAAAEIMPCLLECGAVKGPQYVVELWKLFYPKLLEAIDSEPENDVLADILWGLAKSVEYLGNGCLTEEMMTEITGKLKTLIAKHFEKADNRDKKRKDEDHDEEQEEELQNMDEEDSYVMSKVSDLIHAIFQTHKDAFIPCFELLLPDLQRLLASPRSGDKQWGLCIFDDLLEHGRAHSLKYQNVFVAPMIQGLSNSAAEVRQAAAYGCGLMGMYGENGYAQACAEALPALGNMIESPEARATEENIGATENAISAVAKILKYNAHMVTSAPVISAFITWLPVFEDKEESPHTYGYFCDLVESNHPSVLGENNENLPRVVAVVAEAFRNKAFDETGVEAAQRMCNLIRHIQTNQEMFQACAAHLSEEQQAALQEALTTYPQ